MFILMPLFKSLGKFSFVLNIVLNQGCIKLIKSDSD